MATRIRQVVVATNDLESSVGKFSDDLGSFVAFRDPELKYFGCENALIPVGDCFLEILAPLPGREKNSPAGRFLSRSGEGGYMVILQTANEQVFRAAHEYCLAEGVPIIHEGSRVQDSLKDVKFSMGSGPGFDIDGLSGFHIHPHVAGCIAELILQKPTNKWAWAGNEVFQTEIQKKITQSPTKGIHSVEIETTNVEKLASFWKNLLQLPDMRLHFQKDTAQLILDDHSSLIFRNSSANRLSKFTFISETAELAKPKQQCLVAGVKIAHHKPNVSKI